MGLGWKTALVFALMVAAIVLGVIAKRRNYEGVRRHYTSRRTRVRAAPPEGASGEGSPGRGDAAPQPSPLGASSPATPSSSTDDPSTPSS